jgi:hypothetical protein
VHLYNKAVSLENRAFVRCCTLKSFHHLVHIASQERKARKDKASFGVFVFREKKADASSCDVFFVFCGVDRVAVLGLWRSCGVSF